MAKTYSIMHSITSQYYNTLDKAFNIPMILLGAVTASSIFTSHDTNIVWTYVNGGMVLCMTGLAGVSKFLGTHEKQVKHTSASFKYTQIAMDIDTVLSFPRHERQEDPRKFITEIKLSILEVREHAPNLPTNVVDGYIKKLDKTLTDTKTNVNSKSSIDNPVHLDNLAYISSSSRVNSVDHTQKHTLEKSDQLYQQSGHTPTSTNSGVEAETIRIHYRDDEDDEDCEDGVKTRSLLINESNESDKTLRLTNEYDQKQIILDIEIDTENILYRKNSMPDFQDNQSKVIYTLSNRLECDGSDISEEE
jgi:hypothetical protein